jgi:hypothetical protein
MLGEGGQLLGEALAAVGSRRPSRQRGSRAGTGGPQARDQHRCGERVAFDAGALPQGAALCGGRWRWLVEAGEPTQHVGGKATAVVERMRVAARLVGEGWQPPIAGWGRQPAASLRTLA